jgi:hypothetical protein
MVRWRPGGGPSPARGAGPRVIAVEVVTAVKRETPVRIEALGTVTTMASVAVKSRLDNVIVGIHFADGAYVKRGDLLVTLDSRAGRSWCCHRRPTAETLQGYLARQVSDPPLQKMLAELLDAMVREVAAGSDRCATRH